MGRPTLWLLLALAPGAFGQDATPGQSTLAAPAATEGRAVSWLRLPQNVASDQKRLWTSPLQLRHGRRWLPALAAVSATAVLIGTDERTARYFRKTKTFQGFNSVFTGRGTSLGTWLVPASLYAVGAIRRDSYGKSTALLAGEAVLSAEILTTVMKDIDRRKQPSAYAPGAPMEDSWFTGKGKWHRGIGSFPSGHTIAAFSVATVIARRYPRYRWLPYVAYGLAGLTGFSRMTLSSHYASDVFVGAALGYSISRFVVLRK
jgi:hypothetical protein